MLFLLSTVLYTAILFMLNPIIVKEPHNIMSAKKSFHTLGFSRVDNNTVFVCIFILSTMPTCIIVEDDSEESYPMDVMPLLPEHLYKYVKLYCICIIIKAYSVLHTVSYNDF